MGVSFWTDARPGAAEMPELHWNQANARAMLQVLGLAHDEEGLCGGCTLPEAHRAFVRAVNRGSHAEHTRPERVEHGPPREAEDGTLELRPLRLWSGGLDEDGIRRRLWQFDRFLREAAARGATRVDWG